MRKINVLYVDDDHALLEMFAGIIEKWGHKIDIVNSPSKAFSILSKKDVNYNAILVDYNMPEMNGIDFLSQISSHNFFEIERLSLFSTLALNASTQRELARKLPNHIEQIYCIEKTTENINELREFLTLESGKQI